MCHSGHPIIERISLSWKQCQKGQSKSLRARSSLPSNATQIGEVATTQFYKLPLRGEGRGKVAIRSLWGKQAIYLTEVLPGGMWEVLGSPAECLQDSMLLGNGENAIKPPLG